MKCRKFQMYNLVAKRLIQTFAKFQLIIFINMFQMYNLAVESLEQYEQEIRQCKMNRCWKDLSQIEMTCIEAIQNIVQVEENDLFFTALIHIRNELFQTITKVKMASEQIVLNDITITRINSTNEPVIPPLVSCSVVELAEPQNKKYKKENGDVLYEAIRNTIVAPKSTGLNDVVGLEDAKSILKEAVVLPVLFPHLFTGHRKPWTKALLYGPPGTGKTHLVHGLVAEIGAKLYCVSNADLLSRWVGESEKMIRALFQFCLKSTERCVIFIDEVDGICRKRSATEADHNRRMKTELLVQLSALDTENSSVFFIAATNCPWDIDPAFIRRFQRRIYIPLPDRETRLKILKHYSTNFNLIPDLDVSNILANTDGFSGSDITNLVNCVLYQPLKDLETAKLWNITPDGKYIPAKPGDATSFASNLYALPANKITVREINAQDYLAALRTTTKTITASEVIKFDEFNNSFGSLK